MTSFLHRIRILLMSPRIAKSISCIFACFLFFGVLNCNIGLPKISNMPELAMIANCVTGQPQCVFNQSEGETSYFVGGTISGLVSGTLTIQLNGGSDLTVSTGQTTFKFTAGLISGTSYSVSVKTQPSGLSCNITNGFGTIGENGDVNNVTIACLGGSASPLYSNAQNWNDYIINDGTNMFDATNTACVGTENVYRGCLPAFFYKVVFITGKTTCTNLSISDSLGLLSWSCGIAPNGSAAAISYNISSGKGLADAIDFTNFQFKDMVVTISENSSVYMQTSPQKFWNNQIVSVNSSCVPSAAGSTGAIYAAPADILCSSTVQLGSKMSVVMNSSVKAKMSSTSIAGMIYTNSNHFIWVEGRFDGTNVTAGNPAINLYNSNYSRVQNTQIYNSNLGPGNSGLQLVNSNNNVIYNINLSNNSNGMQMGLGSKYNLFLGLSLSNNNNGIAAYNMDISSNIFLGVTILNSSPFGIDFSFGATGRQNNALIGLTIANSKNGVNGRGIILSGANSAGNLFTHLALVNNEGSGIMIDNPTLNQARNTFLHSAYINNGAAVNNIFQTTNTDYFTGVFKKDSPCVPDGAIGISDIACNPAGLSDFTPTTITTPTTIFRGKVSDLTNTSDDAFGYAAYSLSNDWSYFDNIFRGWGMYDATAFPNALHRDRCITNCQIFDLSLSASSSEIRNILPCPNGNSVTTQYWYATGQTNDASCNLVFPGSKYFSATDCRTTFLRDAIESIGDGTGNDNGLCESNENCLYTPNIGSYQGHGSTKSASAVSGCSDIGTGGIITNVKLYQYSTNGY